MRVTMIILLEFRYSRGPTVSHVKIPNLQTNISCILKELNTNVNTNISLIFKTKDVLVIYLGNQKENVYVSKQLKEIP